MGGEEHLWRSCRDTLRTQLPDGIWKSYFEVVTPLALDGDVLTLGVPNAFARDRITDRYMPLLEDVCSSAAGRPLSTVLAVRPETEPAAPRADETPAAAPQPVGRREWSLNERYTFEAFVIGASNRFAHAAALAVAEKPAMSYNPLFIYGEAGLGKTHLLHAIGHYVRHHYPDMKVRYSTTESFTNEFIESIRYNTQPAFKRRYRVCDVLLIDDIQFLEKRETTREEFFHTFNALHEENCQIVITSDRAPRSFDSLEDRLRSRFEWGLVTDVQPPEIETRLAILRKKAEREAIPISNDVMEYIAIQITDNIRELEGALIRLSAYTRLNNLPITVAVAEEQLHDLIGSKETRQPTPQAIIDAAADMFGMSAEDLRGKSRRRPLVTARQICMYVFRQMTDFSYPAIGREFGGRDHTTVIHAERKIAQLMSERRAIFDQVRALTNRLGGGS